MDSEVNNIDAAQIGRMFVTNVTFQYHAATTEYKNSKTVPVPAHWEISTTLKERTERYADGQTMSVRIEHGIGQKLVEVLLPAIMADASRKAQQIADDSKAMLTALGDRTIKCIAETASKPEPTKPEDVMPVVE